MEKFTDSKFESKGKGRKNGTSKKGPNEELDLRTLEEISETEDEKNLEHGRFIPLEEIAGDDDWEKYGEEPEAIPEYSGKNQEIEDDDPRYVAALKLQQQINDAYEAEKPDYERSDLTEEERQELLHASIFKIMEKSDKKSAEEQILENLKDEPVLPKIKEAPKSKKEKVWNPSDDNQRKHETRRFERFIQKKNPGAYDALQNYKEPMSGDNRDTGTHPGNIWNKWFARFKANSKKDIDPKAINTFLDQQQKEIDSNDFE